MSQPREKMEQWAQQVGAQPRIAAETGILQTMEYTVGLVCCHLQEMAEGWDRRGMEGIGNAIRGEIREIQLKFLGAEEDDRTFRCEKCGQFASRIDPDGGVTHNETDGLDVCSPCFRQDRQN